MRTLVVAATAALVLTVSVPVASADPASTTPAPTVSTAPDGDHVVVTVGPAPGPTPTAYTVNLVGPAGTTTRTRPDAGPVTFTGLTPAASYALDVTATSSSGTSPATTASFTAPAAPPVTVGRNSLTVQVPAAATVLATIRDPLLGPNVESLAPAAGAVTLTGLVPGAGYVLTTAVAGPDPAPIPVVIAAGPSISLFPGGPGPLFGYVSVDGVPQPDVTVGIRRVVGPGRAVSLAHVPTDDHGRFSFTPTSTLMTVRAAVTLGSILYVSPPVPLAATPRLSTLRVVRQGGRTVISGVLGPGTTTSRIDISSSGRGGHRIGRAAVRTISGGRVRFSLTVGSTSVTRTLLITVAGTSLRYRLTAPA